MVSEEISLHCHHIFHLFSDLLQCTNEPNVSIPQLADLLIERTQNTSWVIVFKALVTIHNLMNYGNEVSVGTCKVGWVGMLFNVLVNSEGHAEAGSFIFLSYKPLKFHWKKLVF